MEEIYVSIEGYEGLYEISNLGNVKALNFYGKEGNIKILKQTQYNNTKLVTLKNKDGKQRRFSVGKLMKQHFELEVIEDLDGEEWVDIKGFEGIYMISTYARIKSVKNKTHCLISESDNGRGYPKVSLHGKGKEKSFQVQRLMATHFLGADETTDVTHKDGDRYNNKLDNLYLIPRGSHRFKNNSRRNSKRIKCIELDREFNSIKEASIELGIAYQNILSVLKGRQKTTAKKHFIYL